MGATRKIVNKPAISLPSRLLNRRTWLVVLVSLAVYIVVVRSGFMSGQIMPIRAVEVTGQFQGLKIDALEKAIAGYVDAGFFGADVNAIKLAAEQLPWADSVSVRRVWPDMIQLEVSEQNAIARWRDNAVINDLGELFYPATGNIPTELAQLAGPEGTHTQLLAHFRELQPVLAKRKLAITRLSYNSRRAVELELDNGMHLLIGRVRSVRESNALVTRFALAFDRALAVSANKISSVDLRYTNGFSIQWKDGKDKTARLAGKQRNNNLGNSSRGSVNG